MKLLVSLVFPAQECLASRRWRTTAVNVGHPAPRLLQAESKLSYITMNVLNIHTAACYQNCLYRSF